MRTRSQPDSPGGFQSLETQRATRRTRTTRAAARRPPAEASSEQISEPSTQPTTRSTRAVLHSVSTEPSSQQTPEPSTKRATRSKSQRTVKETATKSTGSTTANSKNETQKATARGTRKSARTTGKATSTHAQDSTSEVHVGTIRTDNEDNAEVGAEKPESAPSASDTALLEPALSELNRKRAHPDSSPENQAPTTPNANKRRNLGTPRHIPSTGRSFKANPVSHSERLRRRKVESTGRIDKTMFRVPQLIAQQEADSRASGSSALTSPSPNLQTSFDFRMEQPQAHEQPILEQPVPLTQQPSTPERAERGWNLRGLIESVPRSLSRFIPRFSRTTERPEVSGTNQPSSERIFRTQPADGASPITAVHDQQSRRRLSEQSHAKRPRDLSYSLFPAPIDRSLYLGDIPMKSPEAPAPVNAPAPVPSTATAPVEEKTPQKPDSMHARGRDSTPQVTNGTGGSQKKKRKRSPSPDVIPNPPGCSYGIDYDYFPDSSDDDEDDEAETAPQTEPRKIDNCAKTALENVAQSERPAAKKVRFDASPEETPSKRRARATDPYTGKQFIGYPSPQPSSSSTPTTPTPASRVSDQPRDTPQRPPGFIPNTSGTYGFDYDDYDDDSDSSGAASPPPTPAPAPISVAYPSNSESDATSSSSLARPIAPESPQLPPRPVDRLAQHPSTPAKPDDEALARVRSLAEKYKPKTPSGLRTTSRYSSPINPTPDVTPAPSVEKITKRFGDDQFGEDAQWLFENCPSGDLSQLSWPKPQNRAESLSISSEAVRILDEIWDPADVDLAHQIFVRDFEEFKKTLADGTS
ncbi:hypothetical protein BJX99DRAFT_217694 [Aspergillus californicus]